MSIRQHRTLREAKKRTRRRFSEIFGELWSEQREQGIFAHRGVIKHQKQWLMAGSTPAVLRSVLRLASGLFTVRSVNIRKDEFEETVRRLRLSQEQLDRKCQHHKLSQIAFYGLAGLVAAFTLHLYLSALPLHSFAAGIGAISLAVNGYLQGFRAWQIEHRNLISLLDALRIRRTYLML